MAKYKDGAPGLERSQMQKNMETGMEITIGFRC